MVYITTSFALLTIFYDGFRFHFHWNHEHHYFHHRFYYQCDKNLFCSSVEQCWFWILQRKQEKNEIQNQCDDYGLDIFLKRPFWIRIRFVIIERIFFCDRPNDVLFIIYFHANFIEKDRHWNCHLTLSFYSMSFEDTWFFSGWRKKSHKNVKTIGLKIKPRQPNDKI